MSFEDLSSEGLYEMRREGKNIILQYCNEDAAVNADKSYCEKLTEGIDFSDLF